MYAISTSGEQIVGRLLKIVVRLTMRLMCLILWQWLCYFSFLRFDVVFILVVQCCAVVLGERRWTVDNVSPLSLLTQTRVRQMSLCAPWASACC